MNNSGLNELWIIYLEANTLSERKSARKKYETMLQLVRI
jgi:hypothetical protein